MNAQWVTVTLTDGRVVGMWIPLQYTPISKCSKKYRCTNWICVQCYDTSFASHSRMVCWDIQSNGVTPREVAISSNKKYWFFCNDCGHKFDVTPNQLSRCGWCPYCANKRRCEDINCRKCYDNSFASHLLSLFWNYQLNIVIPRSVAKCSGEKFWFTCPTCLHNFDININNLVGGAWCPYCANLKRCNVETCTHCYNNSFASCYRSKFWDYSKNREHPREVAKCSNKKYWFICPDCNHSFDITLSDISENVWCPYCANKKRCIETNCQNCFNRTFASCPKSKFWNYQLNKITPREVALNCNEKFWFTCPDCKNNFNTTLNHIVGNRWCPFCSSSHMERIAQEHLISLGYQLSVHYTTQYKIGNRRIDIYIYNICNTGVNVAIELDGVQHFDTVEHFESTVEQQRIIDHCKTRAITATGAVMLRISHNCDVVHWINLLLQRASQLQKGSVYYSDPTMYTPLHTMTAVDDTTYNDIMGFP